MNFDIEQIEKDAMVCILSGIAIYKDDNKKEIWWNVNGYDFTVEIVDEKRTIIRWYFDGKEKDIISVEERYLDKKLHKTFVYYRNGMLSHIKKYRNGKMTDIKFYHDEGEW